MFHKYDWQKISKGVEVHIEMTFAGVGFESVWKWG